MSSPERPPPKFRFTLGQVMIAVAASALLCAVTLTPPGSPGARVDRLLALLMMLLVTAFGILTLLMTVRSVVETCFGTACPHCFRSPLMRVAVHSFGYRYYRCTHCGRRCKRRPWLNWEDAVRSDDDAHYEHRDAVGPPGLVVPRTNDAASWQGTTGALLRNQRIRKPRPPAEPETETGQAGSSGTSKTLETEAPG